MKKLILFFLLLSLLLSSSFVFAVDDAAFPDMPDENHWAYAALSMATQANLLSGSDGMLLPFDNLTRAQMATILVRARKKTEKADLTAFVDVPENAWFHDSMAIAVHEGWFKGDGTGYLNPGKNITRQEVFVVLSRVFGMTVSEESAISKFNDYQSIPDWAKQGTSALVLFGIINGSSDGNIYPQNLITRAEFSQIMFNASKQGFLVLPKKPEIVVVDPEDDNTGGLIIIDDIENDEHFGEVNFGK